MAFSITLQQTRFKILKSTKNYKKKNRQQLLFVASIPFLPKNLMRHRNLFSLLSATSSKPIHLKFHIKRAFVCKVC